MVRGKGNEGIGSTYASANEPSAFAADATGILNQGSLPDYVLGTNAAGTSFNLVGNPYAAPINIKLLKSNGNARLSANNNGSTGVGNTIYVYNPFKNAGVTSNPSQELRGGLDAYTNDGSTDIIIPSYGAFFIQAKALGNVINFDETVKAVGNTPLSLMGNNNSISRFNLQVENDRGAWDDLKLRWENHSVSAGTDSYDGAKMNNELFDLYSITPDGKKLCIDSRSDSFNREEIIPLGINTSVESSSFRFTVTTMELPSNVRVYLKDKLLGTQTELVKTGDSYAFAITADSSTKGDNRFELLFTFKKQAAPTAELLDDMKFMPNPFNDELIIQLGRSQVSATGSTTVRLVNMEGRVLKTTTVGPNTSVIKLKGGSLTKGVYVVEISNDVNRISRQVIKE